jgi:hypothetical protein
LKGGFHVDIEAIKAAWLEFYRVTVYSLGWPVARLLHKADAWVRKDRRGNLLGGLQGGYVNEE